VKGPGTVSIRRAARSRGRRPADAGPGNRKAMPVLIGKIGSPDRKGRRCRRQEPHPFGDPGKASYGSRRCPKDGGSCRILQINFPLIILQIIYKDDSNAGHFPSSFVHETAYAGTGKPKEGAPFAVRQRKRFPGMQARFIPMTGREPSMKTALRLIIMITGFYLLVDIFVDVSARIPDSLRIIRRILKASFGPAYTAMSCSSIKKASRRKTSPPEGKTKAGKLRDPSRRSFNRHAAGTV